MQLARRSRKLVMMIAAGSAIALFPVAVSAAGSNLNPQKNELWGFSISIIYASASRAVAICAAHSSPSIRP
jgi:hypothetical protein